MAIILAPVPSALWYSLFDRKPYVSPDFKIVDGLNLVRQLINYFLYNFSSFDYLIDAYDIIYAR